MTKRLSPNSDIVTGLYKKSTKHFFESSKFFEAQITDIYDHLWQTVAALKMLRWQVRGYYEYYDEMYNNFTSISNSDLSGKFVDRLDKTCRPNLYRVCIGSNWGQTEDHLAKDLLINLFARYEAWLENILRELGESTQPSIQSYSKKLQFPNKAGSAITNLCSGKDITLTNSFYNVYKIRCKDCDIAHLVNYLNVYRYFKELRNSIVHSGEITTDKIISAYKGIVSLTARDLDTAEVPTTFKPIKDGHIEISLRGVVGFSQILLKLVSVLDAELIQATNAKQYFIKKLRTYNGKPNFVKKGNEERKIKSICSKANFLCPQQPIDLYNWLKKQGLIL